MGGLYSWKYFFSRFYCLGSFFSTVSWDVYKHFCFDYVIYRVYDEWELLFILAELAELIISFLYTKN